MERLGDNRPRAIESKLNFVCNFQRNFVLQRQQSLWLSSYSTKVLSGHSRERNSSRETDETLPEAHTALALIVQNYDWDWKTAEKEFRRAIDLNPSYATAHHWYAEHLMWRGRFDEAFQESERARQLDPLSLIIAADNGAILYFSRQYDRAIEKFRSVLEMDPKFPRAHLIRVAYLQKRNVCRSAGGYRSGRQNG
jgi:tetratricopeptide (TPR) repeat protein